MSRLIMWSTLLLGGAFFLPAQADQAPGNAELGQIQRVYLMPMGNAFDQYLANRLRVVSAIRVVTDPTRADAFFTDRLGQSFEAKLDEIEAKAKEQTEEKTAENAEGESEAAKSFKLAPRMTSSISRGKGTVFLVERRSRNVVWSIYEKPKDAQPKTLDKVAEKVAAELKREWEGKK
ncbi:MAG: hypothetical protein NW208_14295 [Bryobacter sp.]|nr:hypothetical protein [Bryobacter sp.]